MTPRSSFVAWASFAAVLTGALALTLSLGGCPIAQQPATPSTTDDQQTDGTGASTTNTRPGGRPIPPPPVDTTDTTGGSGSSGGGTGGDTGGGGDTTFSQPISVVITVPDGFDINILPTGEAFISYEVFGGNPTDGAINVQLFYDQDGLPNTGDEVVLKSNLAPRGTERFVPSLAPGVYRIGIVASNQRDAARTYANGRLVLVGEAGITFNQPTQDLRIRPNTSVQVQLTITSLATALSYTVFTDIDTQLNGNERTAFSAGGLGGTGTILTDNFAPGTYYIGVTATDSVGQTKTQYFETPAGFRKFTIDLAPSVTVSAPNDTRTIDPADPAQRIITVALTASDPEGAAQVQVFRDIDAVFNGNEVPIGAPVQLDSPAPRNLSFDIDAQTLPAGTFKFGATANDGVGQPIVAYAAGTRRINAPPRITITNPLNNVSVPAGAQVVLQWSATDPENRIPNNGVSVLLAPDVDANGQPDVEPTVLATFGSNVTSYPIDTTPLTGRYVAGVRVRDDVGATVTAFAPGAIIVNNEPPTVTINQPTGPVAVRPAAGTTIAMTFTVGDRERSLASPGGVQVVVARDDDENGQPDGDPILTLNGAFGLGFNFYSFDTTQLLAAGILNDLGYGRFLLGVQARDVAGNVTRRWVPLTADRVAPVIELVEPTTSITRDRIGVLQVIVRVTDTSNDFNTVRAILDNNAAPLQRDTNPVDPSEYELTLVSTTPTGTENQNEYVFEINLDAFIPNALPADVYFLYIVVDDNIGATRIERIGFYNPSGETNPLDFHTAWIRDRLMGRYNLAQLDNSPDGAVLRGFNFNDLAGSAIEPVGDADGDGTSDFMLASRFSKAYLVELGQSIGFGEGYLIYGDQNRLRGIRNLNAVGRGNIPGLIFPGIRAAIGRSFIGTEGLSGVTVIPDMDGDNLPEFVFGFPRVESVSLSVEDPRVQDPGVFPDLPGMGSLEFNAWNAQMGVWTPNQAQFTRGGVVIASSHNLIVRNKVLRNRRNDRTLDLHEVGQLFSGMSAPQLVPYVRPQGNNCGPDDNTHVVGGVACGAQPDLCPVDPTIQAGRGACCINGNPQTCQVMTEAQCTAAGGTYAGNQVACLAGPNPCPTPQEQDWNEWQIRWDVVFNNQGPGGFHMPWTTPPADPPLANPVPFPYAPAPMRPPAWYGDHGPHYDPTALPPIDLRCTNPPDCFWVSSWFNWTTQTADGTFPCTNMQLGVNITNSWLEPTTSSRVWTGFYGPTASIREDTIGARVLGQSVNDHFGTSVATDGVWLLVSAPDRRPVIADVPDLTTAGGARAGAGVVYMLRVDSRQTPTGVNKAQLWMERTYTNEQGGGTLVWPNIDAEIPPAANQGEGLTGRLDFTMPVPHQYIIESGGSLRGDDRVPGGQQNSRTREYSTPTGGTPNFCPPAVNVTGGLQANACSGYLPYPVDTAGYHAQTRPFEIVGPHVNARLAYTRALGDSNGDGVRDFAVGSTQIRATFTNPQSPSGSTLGGVFVVYSRPTGVQGDLLLERMSLDAADVRRLDGVYIKGTATAPIGRAFDNGGDFNGDGADDIIVGSELSSSSTGEVVVVFGSRSGALRSPGGGWTFDGVVAAGRAVRFHGEQAGDLAGANVATCGDVDGDGFGDILIAAPGAVDPVDSGRRTGIVYLIYGSDRYGTGDTEFNLADVGTAAVPGVKFVGRTNLDALGGGQLATPANLNPPGVPTPAPILSRGVSAIGDVDGDGFDDYVISAILADPENKTNAGEVYLIYGKGDRVRP